MTLNTPYTWVQRNVWSLISDPSSYDLQFTSEDPAICRVGNESTGGEGYLIGVAPGTTTIHVSANDGSSTTFTVIVN